MYDLRLNVACEPVVCRVGTDVVCSKRRPRFSGQLNNVPDCSALHSRGKWSFKISRVFKCKWTSGLFITEELMHGAPFQCTPKTKWNLGLLYCVGVFGTWLVVTRHLWEIIWKCYRNIDAFLNLFTVRTWKCEQKQYLCRSIGILRWQTVITYCEDLAG